MGILRNIFWIFILSEVPVHSQGSGVDRSTITIATIVPADNNRLFSIQRIQPALEIGIEKVYTDNLIPNKNISVHFADSKCSIGFGMNEAINFYIDKEVDVFFGPCCDYAAAPVGRQIKYWDIPMITPGAVARDFAQHKPHTYTLMTRVGPSVNSLNQMITAITTKFKWKKLKIIYNPQGQRHITERYCHIVSDGMHYGIESRPEYYKFDTPDEILDHLETQIGRDYAVYMCIVSNGVYTLEVKIATIVPFKDNTSNLFSLNRIKPAVEIALEKIHNKSNFPENVTFSVQYADSDCNIAIGMKEAIEIYMEGDGAVHAFLGPVCDYSVAPVARQVKYWNIPLLSCGAMARDFAQYRSSSYPLLTRAGPSYFNTLSSSIVELFNKYKWKNYNLLYSQTGQNNIMLEFCYLASIAVHYDIKEGAKHIHQKYVRVDDDVDHGKLLKEEIGNKFGGKVENGKPTSAPYYVISHMAVFLRGVF